ncbi:MaoC family dehydratase [Kitasatospora cathayae]|uniref:MaoC family dehydratase n=1 Tax=Kitasatospora cathayae TaxID=3004092 RepID=A0ABY7PXI4_9ACTN|nr:MaoC family dehydratase [Kitasatospora sp. HUAS 3-15]WBP85096.1 MaoC family dehydratase [Kitasatospora sp. HUAS 3-15]
MYFFEDFAPGDVFELGTVSVTMDQIIEFSETYDPQPFHVDPELALASPFEGLIASGWQTASLFMRRYVDGLLADSACVGSPGVDEIRYHRPVRPGDVLHARVRVLGSSPSFGRSDTGIVKPMCELVDEEGRLVFSMILHSIFERRLTREPVMPMSIDPVHPARSA